MGAQITSRSTVDVWGPYPNYDDIAKLEYGRLLWKTTHGRQRLLTHWMDPKHPHAERFLQNRSRIEEILESSLIDEDLDRSLRAYASSLRAAARDIPSVFGSLDGRG